MRISKERQIYAHEKRINGTGFYFGQKWINGRVEIDTIGGFNGMIRKRQQEEGEANVTTVLFNDQVELVDDRFPLPIVKPLTEDDYYVRGMTALLDAVGSTVKKMENIQNRLPDDMKAEKVLVVITTEEMDEEEMEDKIMDCLRPVQEHLEREDTEWTSI